MKMNRTLTALVATSALLSIVISNTNAQGIDGDDVIIKLKPSVLLSKVLADHHTTLDDHVTGSDIYAIRIPQGLSLIQFIAELKADNRIIYAEDNVIIQNPEFDGKQMHFAFDAGPNPGSYNNNSVYAQINLSNSWKYSTGVGGTVAVLDTGGTPNHPVLKGRYIDGFNAINSRQKPLDIANGVTNAAVGHGTMIAGIIARIAPNAKIMPVKVLNADGVGRLIDVIQGLNFAISHGAKVINMSFGSSTNSEALQEAMDYAENAKVVIVASAGNDGANLRQYPACLGSVLAVTSVEQNNKKSDYANFGNFIFAAAPGTGIRSTYWNGGYATWSGTSFSTPFVTGQAALILSNNLTAQADKVAETIKETAKSLDKSNPNYLGKLGSGLIDIYKSVLFQFQHKN